MTPPDPFEGLAEAFDTFHRQELLLASMYTIAIEYQKKTIDAFRFSDRVIELLENHQRNVSSAAQQRQSKEE